MYTAFNTDIISDLEDDNVNTSEFSLQNYFFPLPDENLLDGMCIETNGYRMNDSTNYPQQFGEVKPEPARMCSPEQLFIENFNYQTPIVESFFPGYNYNPESDRYVDEVENPYNSYSVSSVPTTTTSSTTSSSSYSSITTTSATTSYSSQEEVYSHLGSYDLEELKRPKKRKRKSTLSLPQPEKFESDIKFYEDALISLDSISFDEYMDRISIYRRFNQEEKDKLRDIKKRIKNRESARKSRNNKRNKLETLEYQVKDLTEETVTLREEISYLTQENHQLKSEVVYLRNYYSNPETKVEHKLCKEESKSMINGQSILLFVILFSFGIFWNLDGDVFGTSIGFSSKNNHFRFAETKGTYEDPSLDLLLNKIDSEDISKEDIRSFRDYDPSQPKKDVEICCF